jgi:hypothetical protein
MKTRLLAIAAACLAILPQVQAQYTDLLSLSSPASFGPLSSPTFTFANTNTVTSQTVAGFVVNGGVISGDNIYATLASNQDWSSYNFAGPNQLALFMNTAAPNPDVSFSLELFDGSGGTIDIWSGDTGASAYNGYVNLSISSGGTADYSEIGSYIITWNNFTSATIDTTMSKIAVVPEPSTYALLALSGLALGGYAMRRRCRA